MGGLFITAVDPAQPSVAALIAELDALQSALYPPEANNLDSIAELQRDNVFFCAGFESPAQKSALGCGGLKILRDDRDDGWYGEIKRVYVRVDARRRGIARQILAHLEQHARNRPEKLVALRVETGCRQPEALGLYERLGFTPRPPFGAYQANEFSLFLEKRLCAGGALIP